MINYKEIILKYPWIVKENQEMVLSPDSDGFLSGLLMSHYLNWETVGFYDGKVLLLKKGLSAQDCIFLDVDIFRKNIRSLGHHMVLYDKNNLPPNWNNFRNCIQPNNIRNYDITHDFSLKYPFASIHLLLGILGSQQEIKIPKSAICPLLYTDGVFKNLFNFPENCLSWISFLGGDEEKNPLHQIFYNKYYLVSDLMLSLRNLFKELSKIKEGRGKADKLKISNSRGEPINLIKQQGGYAIIPNERDKVEQFLKFLSSLVEWDYKKDKWNWELFKIYKFTKENIKPSKGRYNILINKNPLSLAMTSTLAIEYTLEGPNKLP